MVQQLEKFTRVCPKCHSNSLHVMEMTLCSAVWEVIDGLFNLQDGDLNPEQTTGVFGRCLKCEHEWKFRGAVTISSLIEEGE